MPTISLITPVYNVQDYLDCCIRSVLSQSFQDWEYLLVNDGSFDRSGEICDAYASQDNRIRVFHLENGGPSKARNFAIHHAQGRYVFFLDSDDWLSADSLSVLIDLAESKGCDVVQGGFYYAYNNYMLLDERYHSQYDKPLVLNRYQAMYELIQNKFLQNFAWGKLYKRDVIVQHLFPVDIKFGEDYDWQHSVFHGIHSVCVCFQPLYYYRQRENGLSGSFSERNLELLKAYAHRLAFVSQHYPSFLPLMKSKFFNLACDLIECAIASKNVKLIALYKGYMAENDLSYHRIWYKVKSFYQRFYDRLFGKKLTRISY